MQPAVRVASELWDNPPVLVLVCSCGRSTCKLLDLQVFLSSPQSSPSKTKVQSRNQAEVIGE